MTDRNNERVLCANTVLLFSVLLPLVRLAAVALVVIPVASQGQENAPDPAGRLKEMTDRAQSLKLSVTGQHDELRVRPQPLFRFSDPTRRTTDGSMWIWTEAERPVAAVCVFVEPVIVGGRAEDKWSYEFLQLSNKGIEVTGRPQLRWTPRIEERTWLDLDGPEPAPTEAARLGQMRHFVRQFEAEEVLKQERFQLRLVSQPAYRYSSRDGQIADGSLFLFAYGTNPELLVQIEAVGKHWRVAFGRLSAARLEVKRNGQQVWGAEDVVRWDATKPYFAHFGADIDREDKVK